MSDFLLAVGLGLLIVVLGIVNMSGNISSLHWYHRKRVREEDKKPFGKMVGLGTLIIGVAMIQFGVLSFVSNRTENLLYGIVGTALLLFGFVVGLSLSFWAMIKYNKGLF